MIRLSTIHHLKSGTLLLFKILFFGFSSFSLEKIYAEAELNPQIQAVVDKYEALPQGAALKTNLYGIPVYETPEKKLNDEEVGILKEILNGIPQEILNIKPNAFIATTRKAQKSDLIRANAFIAAFAGGPNIYLVEETFVGPQILGPEERKLPISLIRQSIIHEFVHIAQYRETPKENLKEGSFSAFDHAPMVAAYAEEMGWEKRTIWALKDEQAKNSWYGKLWPVEDQAEAIARYATGHIEEIDQKRIDWITKWLGKPPEAFSQGVIPTFPQYRDLRVQEKDLPADKVSAYKSEFKEIEMFGWMDPYNKDISYHLDYYQRALPERGWQGSFVKEAQGYAGEWVFQDQKKAYIEILPVMFGIAILVLEGSR